jgi:hypothetical protein
MGATKGGGKGKGKGKGKGGGGGYTGLQDVVPVILKRQTAIDLLNALIIALGVVPQPKKKKGKGKKKGGGKKHGKPHKYGKGKKPSGKPKGKPSGKTAGKPGGVKPKGKA